MSDQEGFLTRWSRRKRAADTSPRARGESLPSGNDPRVGERSEPGEAASEDSAQSQRPPHPNPLPASGEREPAYEGREAGSGQEAGFDPASLPPIESIEAGTDIRAFLQPGVPAELTRAALRRAWVADPAIRDFVGLAENAWDFTAPGGAPGFAPLSADEVQRLAAQFFGSAPLDTEAPATPPREKEGPAEITGTAQEEAPPSSRIAQEPAPDHVAHDPRPADENAAVQDEKTAAHPVRRRHGGALAE